MPKNRIITHKIKRGSLIQYALDGIKRESFEVMREELASLLKHRAGVYALYQHDKPVRVGLGTSIFWRLADTPKTRSWFGTPPACSSSGKRTSDTSETLKQR